MRKFLDYNLNWNEYFRSDPTSPSGIMRIKNRVGKDIEAYVVGTKHYQREFDAHNWQLRFQGKNLFNSPNNLGFNIWEHFFRISNRSSGR